MESLIILVAFLALIWFLMIRPQQRRMRAHQTFVASIDVGDDVVTTSGLHGRVISIDTDQISLEVAPGVELRFDRQAMLRRVGGSAPEPPAEPGAAEPDT